jgi:hypothetical protein
LFAYITGLECSHRGRTERERERASEREREREREKERENVWELGISINSCLLAAFVDDGKELLKDDLGHAFDLVYQCVELLVALLLVRLQRVRQHPRVP